VAEIQAQHPDRRIVVYFEDEARFGYLNDNRASDIAAREFGISGRTRIERFSPSSKFAF
jgi:hypothetical protein